MRVNRTIRQILAINALMWLSGLVMAQTDNFDLYVSFTDSVVVSLDLANLRSLKFSYTDRTMTADYRDGSSHTHNYARVGCMYFAAASGTNEMEAGSEMLYSLQGNILTLREGAQRASLYRLDGVLVKNIADRLVSLHDLQPGIYVLHVDNQTAKLCVQ